MSDTFDEMFKDAEKTAAFWKARLKLAEDRGNDLAMANAHLKRVLETLGAPVEWKEIAHLEHWARTHKDWITAALKSMDEERKRGELLRAALHQAATSLRTIATAGGRMEGLEDLQAVRGYANSRCNAAAAVLESQSNDQALR